MQSFPDFSGMFLLQTLFLMAALVGMFYSHRDPMITVPNLVMGRKKAWEPGGTFPRQQRGWIDRHISEPLLVAAAFWDSSGAPYSPCSPRRLLHAQLGSLSRDV